MCRLAFIGTARVVVCGRMTSQPHQSSQRLPSRAAILATLVGVWAVGSYAQTRLDPTLLALKKTVADLEHTELAMPFIGVRTTDGTREGLFPIRATGISTGPLRRALPVFRLTPQIIRTSSPSTIRRAADERRQRIYVRQGVSLAK